MALYIGRLGYNVGGGVVATGGGGIVSHLHKNVFHFQFAPGYQMPPLLITPLHEHFHRVIQLSLILRVRIQHFQHILSVYNCRYTIDLSGLSTCDLI